MGSHRSRTIILSAIGVGVAVSAAIAWNRLGETPTIYAGAGTPSAGLRFLIYGAPASPTTVPGVVRRGCAVWVDLSLPIVLHVHPPGLAWQLPVPLANNPALVGIQVRAQAVYGPMPFTLSNGLQMTVGTR